MGRVYVKTKGKLSYDDWCEGIREGRSYVSDGRTHLMELEAVSPTGTVRKLGDKGSELRLASPTTIQLRAKVSSRMVGVSETFVEAIVNGYPVARVPIRPNGTLQTVTFEVPIERSSWVALRTFPSAHTNPIFVLVGDKPIRASKRSAEWCLKGVEQCWSQKERFYRGAERLQAEKDYDYARAAYRRIREECER
jgi:hypothetical protein